MEAETVQKEAEQPTERHYALDRDKTRQDWFDELPGETVLEFVRSKRTEAEGQPGAGGLEFRVRQLTAGRHFPKDPAVQRETVFEAATPYRSCVYQGGTPQEALSALLMGVGLLCRDGSMDPNTPHSQGSPIIQHALNILCERLRWQVERRSEKLRYECDTPQGKVLYSEPNINGMDKQRVDLVTRDNEIISSIATAISALARVKDL